MCESSRFANCQTCANHWEPGDTNVPGPCPACGSTNILIERCENCPLTEIDWARSRSHAGHLLDRVLDLEFECDKFSVPWESITAEERRGLQILAEERVRKIKDDRDEEERQRRIEAMFKGMM